MPSYEDTDLTTDAFYDALLDDNVEDLYENAPCGYLSTSPDGTIVKVNRTFLTWSGHERAALIGRRRFPELLTAGGRIFYETHIAPMLRMQDRAREIAVDLACPDGRRLPVLVNAVLKRTPAGDPTVVRIAIFDATERRAYERELLEARQRAEASEARAIDLARTLQASFIPPEPPSVPGLDVAARYRPAGDGNEVGGDFYDVFESVGGEWAVVLGDVCGKGVEAATVTTLARYTVRAAAVQLRSPAAVLTTLNDAILRQHVDRFCTAVYATLRLSGDVPVITSASGGHPLPIHVKASGVPAARGAAGTLLGILPDIQLHEHQATLDAGDVLLLYTDGATEARSPDGAFFGETRLAAEVAALAHRSADEIVDHLTECIVSFQANVTRDDLALVVLKNAPAG